MKKSSITFTIIHAYLLNASSNVFNVTELGGILIMSAQITFPNTLLWEALKLVSRLSLEDWIKRRSKIVQHRKLSKSELPITLGVAPSNSMIPVMQSTGLLIGKVS